MNVVRWTRRAALLAITLSAAGSMPAKTMRKPVLVELFTSEGCSSCPSADSLLAKLERDQAVPGAEIIVLGEHVDYWDSLGWHDRFSSHQFTERQNQYSNYFHLGEVYTPQMVVNGSAQFVGNDERSADRAIERAAARALQLPLAVSANAQGGRLSGTVSLPSWSSAIPPAALYAALVSPMETTQVRSGENGGRTLRHVGVVRSLTRIGELKVLEQGPLAFELTNLERGSTSRLVVFAQSEESGSILGASSISVSRASAGAVAPAMR